jgi:glycosyltransferase involved in cell wall biosynthesis
LCRADEWNIFVKILHLIDSGGLYGAEVVLLNLMKEQTRVGLIPLLGSIRRHKEPSQKAIEAQARSNGLQVIEFAMKNGPNVFGAMRIIRFAKESKFDIIHCHGYKANILMGLMPASYRKIPYIVTLHGWTSRNIWTRIWFYEWLDALMARRADRIVMVTSALQKDFRVRLLGLRGNVVHNGIPSSDDEFKDESQARVDVKDFCAKHFTIGTISRLAAEKGVDVLIRSVGNVIKKGLNVSLVIIGDGRERQRLEMVCDSIGIRDKVLFTGYIPHASAYLSIIEFFVISSFTEGLPITLLEAMRAGTPVIATNVGGIPEVLDDGRCGMLVDSGNEAGLIEAIQKLYHSEDMRKTFRAAAKKRFEEQFTLDKMESRYRQIYSKVYPGLKR